MVAIDEIVIHPSYDPSGYPYDIALLKVLFSISQGTSVSSNNMSHFNFNQSKIMDILQNIAKGTTDPGVDCFDQ